MSPSVERRGVVTAWYLAGRVAVRDIINASGQLINHIDYDSFGRVLAQTNVAAGDRFLYTGREFDAETSLYYYRARYYDPALGRFINQDPLGFGAGDMNLYRYVGNNPLSATDPFGMTSWTEWTVMKSRSVGAFIADYVCPFLELWAQGTFQKAWEGDWTSRRDIAMTVAGIAISGLTQKKFINEWVGPAFAVVSTGMALGSLVNPNVAALMGPLGGILRQCGRPKWMRDAGTGIFGGLAIYGIYEAWTANPPNNKLLAVRIACAGLNLFTIMNPSCFTAGHQIVVVEPIDVADSQAVILAGGAVVIVATLGATAYFAIRPIGAKKSRHEEDEIDGSRLEYLPSKEPDPFKLEHWEAGIDKHAAYSLTTSVSNDQVDADEDRFAMTSEIDQSSPVALCERPTLAKPRSCRARSGLNVAALAWLVMGTALLGTWTLSSTFRHAAFAAASISTTREVLRTKNIEDIKAGDRVLARHEHTGEKGVRSVVETYIRTANHLRILKIESSDGSVQTIETTDEHPFKVDGRLGWIDAKHLQIGDRVVHSDGSSSAVISSVYESRPEGVQVFNFQVEEFHTYFVGAPKTQQHLSVFVHNANGYNNKRQAEEAAMAEADAVKAEGKKGAASALAVDGEVFTGRSTKAGGGPVHPDVQKVLDMVPASQRSDFHGKCAEPVAISKALEAGVVPRGGASDVVTAGGKNHGQPKVACTTCAWLLKFFGVTDANR